MFSLKILVYKKINIFLCFYNYIYVCKNLTFNESCRFNAFLENRNIEILDSFNFLTY